MANRSKQNQSKQTQVNQYEINRLLRVQENKRRMHDLGLKKISNSLTSLVETQNFKKKKVKPTLNNARDVDYVPNIGDESEEDYTEVDTSVQVSKKQPRPTFIAPLSINKIANLTKQNRVIAPKVSREFQLDSNAKKKNQCRATTTMGEIILKKQTGVLKKNAAIPNCTKRGSKKQLCLVDEFDDEDEGIFQDDDGFDMELDGLESSDSEWDIMRKEDGVDQEEDYEDMEDTTMANNENETQMANSNEEMENEGDVQLQSFGLEQVPILQKAIETSKTKKRGPTMLHALHTRKVNEREVIICNEFGQPVGPEEKGVVGKFSRFLGTLARNHSYAPLIYSTWHKVPHKNKLWEYVLEKYDVPEAAKKWVLKTIGHAYKVHKIRFKSKHFYQFKDNKTRWKNRPQNIPEGDFSQLLRLWNNKDVEKRCLQAKEIRMTQKNMHTAGPKSFARIRDKLRNEDPNKELPSLTQLFEHTRKRTEGRAYLDTYDDTARKIEQMKNYKSQEDGSALVDPFTVVMNKEHAGYVRLYGKGVTKKMVKTLDGGEEPYMISGGLMESLKASIEVEKTQLLEMRKEMEEDHQRKKAELEAMRMDFNTQRENLEAKMRDIMENRLAGIH